MTDRTDMFAPLGPDNLADATGPLGQAPEPDMEWVGPVPVDAPAPSFRHGELGEPSQVWRYPNETGETLGYVCRFDTSTGEKEIRSRTCWRNSAGQTVWCWKSFPGPRPLYRLDLLVQRPDAPVLVVEGEKAADEAQKLFRDHVAITSPGGANAAMKADWRPLKGRDVIVWGDHDEPGRQYAEKVRELVSAAGAKSVRIVPIPDSFPESWDLADDLPPAIMLGDLRRMVNGTQDAPPAKAKPEAASAADDPDLDAVLVRLAALPIAQYERVRKEEADRLGFRASILDRLVHQQRPVQDTASGRKLELEDPEPWSDPVDGAELLDQLCAVLQRHMVLPADAACAAALWCVHTYSLEAAQNTPRLAITSPEKRCGKTTLLSVLSRLVRRPISAANIRSAALFRTIELASPTFLIDEADTFLGESEEMRGVLNSGHSRASAYVIRCVGDDSEPRLFGTWGAVVIAAIGKLPGTLMDRSIEIALRRRRPDEKVERLRLDRAEHLDRMARMVARWAADNCDQLLDADPDVPAALHDRAADNWRPLLAIADAAGGEWSERARKAALSLSGAEEGEDASVSVLLLGDLRSLFEDRDTDRLSSSEICEALARMEDRPWPEWKVGRPMTARQLARVLTPFKIGPKQVRFASGTTSGYHRDQFSDAWGRYLHQKTPFQSPTVQHSKQIKDLAETQCPTPETVLEIENGEIANNIKAVGDVGDQKGVSAAPAATSGASGKRRVVL